VCVCERERERYICERKYINRNRNAFVCWLQAMINTESSCLQLVAKQQRKLQGGGCLKVSPVGGKRWMWLGKKRSRSWSGIVEKEIKVRGEVIALLNPLTPNDPYRGRTAPLTSKRCILYIYSTNIGTEYLKHGIYSPLFFLSSKCSLLHNSNIIDSCFIHILYTECAKIKKIIPAPKS
jgi:hypothetical protein